MGFVFALICLYFSILFQVSTVRSPWTIQLLAAALLLGGLRDPRLAALGEAAVFFAVWRERPALGPAAPWLPWLAWLGLASLLSVQPIAAFPALARWSAALAFASLAGAWDERGRDTWLKIFLGAAAVLAAAALWTGAGNGFRAAMTGLLPPYYNYTAFALAAAGAASAAWALHPKSRPKLRPAALLLAAACVACLVLAHSRGAILGLVAAAAVWSIRRWGAKAAAVAAVAAALLLVPGRSLLLKPGRYQEARPEIWARAAEIASAKPAFGEGPGNFGTAFRRRPVEVRGGMARWGMGTDFAHSEFLQAAAETGWAGFSLWLLGFGAALSALWGRARPEPAREAAAAACAAMAVQLVVDNMLQLPGLAFLFFSAAAVAGESASRRPWPRWVAAAGLAFALLAWIPRALARSSPARAAALFPAEADPREDLAYAAMTARRWDEADAHLARAEELAPFNAVYPWRRAQIAAEGGRWNEAEALAARAAGLEPGFLNARILLAEALERQGRRPEGREALASALESFNARGERLGSSGYDNTVWNFDRAEHDRVAARLRR